MFLANEDEEKPFSTDRVTVKEQQTVKKKCRETLEALF